MFNSPNIYPNIGGLPDQSTSYQCLSEAVVHRNALFFARILNRQIYYISDAAASRCAHLIEAARSNEIEPYMYLHHVVKKLPADTVEKIEALMPWNVKGQMCHSKENKKTAEKITTSFIWRLR